MTARDVGEVFWLVRDKRWHSVCGVRGCGWKASHEVAEAGVSAIRAHLIDRHLGSPIDMRSEPRGQ